MKHIPILFSTEMVLAILDGRKTMTRRIIKPQPKSFNEKGEPLGELKYAGIIAYKEPTKCPYGKPGDILWVRETWCPVHPVIKGEVENTITTRIYKASYTGSGYDGCWKPSIFMPKSKCRIFLEVVSVKVERLNDITEQDSIAEGIEREGEGFKSYETIHVGPHKGEPHPHSAVANKSPLISFAELWESINGPDSWKANPWVWVIEFKRVEKPADFIPEQKAVEA